MCVLSHVFCNKFCEFLQLVCFSCHLQVTLAPGPHAVKPARFFATRRANKIQGLSNQYQHSNCFQFLTGRNKPPGEISQSPRPRPPRPPVTHTVCGPGCRRLVRPHTCRPHSLKNQLHSTRPPRPHSLAGRPRTHSAGGEGARRPPLAVTKTLRRWRLCYSNLHPWLLWPFTNTSEKNQTTTRVRVPVVMHVFHINKIVIISFSEVSTPATLSR